VAVCEKLSFFNRQVDELRMTSSPFFFPYAPHFVVFCFLVVRCDCAHLFARVNVSIPASDAVWRRVISARRRRRGVDDCGRCRCQGNNDVDKRTHARIHAGAAGTPSGRCATHC
jgi:hypothetical protein